MYSVFWEEEGEVSRWSYGKIEDCEQPRYNDTKDFLCLIRNWHNFCGTIWKWFSDSWDWYPGDLLPVLENFGIVSPDLTGSPLVSEVMFDVMTEHDFIRTFIFVLYPGAIGTILFFTAWVFQVYLAAVFSVVTQCSSPPPPLHCGEEYCVTTLKMATR